MLIPWILDQHGSTSSNPKKTPQTIILLQCVLSIQKMSRARTSESDIVHLSIGKTKKKHLFPPRPAFLGCKLVAWKNSTPCPKNPSAALEHLLMQASQVWWDGFGNTSPLRICEAGENPTHCTAICRLAPSAALPGSVSLQVSAATGFSTKTN